MWPQSVDVALCFGWIDGIRKSIDHEGYMIRFTPRKKSSVWSNVNIKKVEELAKAGLMTAAGLKAFDERKAHKSGTYSFEQKIIPFDTSSEKKFRTNKKAWNWFSGQAPSYKKPATWWVMSAKKEETKSKRLQILIADSEKGIKIGLLRRP